MLRGRSDLLAKKRGGGLKSRMMMPLLSPLISARPKQGGPLLTAEAPMTSFFLMHLNKMRIDEEDA